MPEELTVMPEPSGREPAVVQARMIEVREAQMLKCQEAKSIGIGVIRDTLQWAADVQSGREQIVEYNQQGEAYPVNGKKYIFEKSLAIKSLVAAVETIEGKTGEAVDQLAAAILNRSKEKPKMIQEGEIVSSEVVG